MNVVYSKVAHHNHQIHCSFYLPSFVPLCVDVNLRVLGRPLWLTPRLDSRRSRKSQSSCLAHVRLLSAPSETPRYDVRFIPLQLSVDSEGRR